MSNKKSVLHIFVTIVIILAIGVQSCSKVSRIGQKSNHLINWILRKWRSIRIVIRPSKVGKITRTLKPLHHSYKSSKQVLVQPVVKTRLISFFPSTEIQYKNVYGKAPTMIAEASIRHFDKILDSEKTVIKVGLDDVNKIFEKIESAVEDTMVIIAHSTNYGQKIIFPNGGSITIEKLHQKCLDFSKKCLVLTCYSHDFNFDTQIDPFEAFRIWKAIAKKARVADNLDIGGLAEEVEKVRNELKNKTYIVISSVTVTGVGSILYVKISNYSLSDQNGSIAK